MLLENPARDSRLKKEQERKAALRKQEKERKKGGVVGRRKREARGVWKFEQGQIKCVPLVVWFE